MSTDSQAIAALLHHSADTLQYVRAGAPTDAHAPDPAGPVALADAVWIASYVGIHLGYYTNPDAARDHCNDEARTVQGLPDTLTWRPDEDEPESRQHQFVDLGDVPPVDTGFRITAIVPVPSYTAGEEA
ncbi:hypothetical protein ACFYWS_20675 [Streptomyces sp. NPDC002795]|uniref:hypothetical protein n=1 Tax=Streptomyces sp. NPDC002795 TaxID=3364665 RepID=UPI0036B3D9A6